MRIFFVLSFLLSIVKVGLSQETTTINSDSKKGKLYIFWGWNRANYSSSDIKFRGADHNFVLKKVKGHDHDLDFKAKVHLNPGKMTIPQFNFRAGYYLNDNWDVSIGMDHMKYVANHFQTVKISGYIKDTQTIYDGVYDNNNIVLSPEDFLEYEHTDGLNYINLGIRRNVRLLKINKIGVNLLAGLEAGVILPKTNSNFLNKGRNDEFHLSGYGINAIGGLNVTFFNSFFLQTELKSGYINMPSIRTTPNPADKASQDFLFSQWNFTFGGIINLNKSKKVKNNL